MTEAAVNALKDLRRDAEVPDDSAIRIQMMQSEPDARPGIGFIFVERPEQGDEVVSQQEGISVFVAPDLANPLSEAVLDAQPTDGGAMLVLRDQGQGEGPAGS